MHIQLIMCITIAVCLCAVPILAASSSYSRSALSQIKTVDKSLRYAVQDAYTDGGKVSMVMRGQGADTLAIDTVDTLASKPVKQEVATYEAKPENASHKKIKDRDRAKKVQAG
jgi:hypothetical protein